jgi:hypothetical protein
MVVAALVEARLEQFFQIESRGNSDSLSFMPVRPIGAPLVPQMFDEPRINHIDDVGF